MLSDVCTHMPRRNRINRRKNPRRKFNRVKPHHRRLVNRVPQGAAPVAKKHLVRLKYSEVYDFSITTGNTGVQVFNLNSVFDPDQTGAGHQPYGFDQMAALFAHYRVYKCSWHISFAGSNDRLHIVVLPINGTATPSVFSEAAEQPLAVSKAMSYDGGFPIHFRGQQYLPRLTGASSIQYRTDDRYSAAVTASPSEVMRLRILIYNPSPNTVVTSCNVTLMYHTEFYDPNTLGPS